MALDPSGATLAGLIIASLPPTETPPTPAGVAANLAHWTAISKTIIDYFIANTVVNVAVVLPASGVATILAPTMAGPAPCTGTGSGTGTGTIS